MLNNTKQVDGHNLKEDIQLSDKKNLWLYENRLCHSNSDNILIRMQFFLNCFLYPFFDGISYSDLLDHDCVEC